MDFDNGMPSNDFSIINVGIIVTEKKEVY